MSLKLVSLALVLACSALSQTIATLTASPTSINCAIPSQGGSTPPQTIRVVSTPPSAGTGFRIVVDGGTSELSGPPWLTVTPATGAVPSRLTVRCNALQLAATYYTARIRVVPTQGSQNPINIPVTFEVQNTPPKLEATPDILKYVWRQGQGVVITQSFLMHNSGSGGPIAFRAFLREGNSWIRGFRVLQPTADTPGRLEITVDGAGLAPGTYRGSFDILSNLPDIVVPISLFVSPSPPNLEVLPTGLLFEQLERSGGPPQRNLTLLNSGATPLPYTVDIQDGLNVVGVGNGQGVIPAGGSATVSVIPISNGLNVGNYYALLRIDAPAANNAPLFVPVVVSIRANTTSDATVVSPSGLVFVATPNQLSQSSVIRVFASSPRTVNVYAGVSSDDGAGWMGVSPSSGQATSANSAQFNLSINAQSLKPGVYTGVLNVQVGVNDIRNTNVTLIVPKIAGANARSEAGPSLAGCTPARLTATSTGLVNNFSTPSGWPVPLQVRVADDCGDVVTNAQVTASFSNGDPALTMKPVGTSGNYSATWTPGGAPGQVAIRATAVSSTLVETAVDISGGVTPNVVPLLSENGTVNNLHRQIGAALAPGTIIEVYGSNLAAQTALATTVPLPTSLGGTRVIVDGRALPLYFISPGQINAQVPTDLVVNRQSQILVNANNAITLPDTINISPASPGVAAFDNGVVKAQHSADFREITAADPAEENETVVVYLVGMGGTTTPVGSGQASPGNPLPNATTQPVVTLAGRTCESSYAGLTPGFVGLYQINFRVPVDVPSGNLPLVIKQNDVEANRSTLPVR